MHLGANADSVVPTGLDLGAALFPGLKPGAILFHPFGTECAPARQRVPVRTGWAATGGGPYKGKRNLALQETACEADAWQHDSLGVLV